MRKQDGNKTCRIYTMSILFGLSAWSVIMLLSATAMTKYDLSSGAVSILAVIGEATGAFVSALICAKKQGRGGLKTGAITGGVFFAVTFTAGVVSGSMITILTPIKLIVLLLAGSCGGIAGVNSKAKRKI